MVRKKDSEILDNNSSSYNKMKAEIDEKLSKSVVLNINQSKDQLVKPDNEVLNWSNRIESLFSAETQRLENIKRAKSVLTKNFTPFNFCDVITKSLCCTKKKSKSKNPSKSTKFNMAEQILFKEMDIVRILNEIMELRDLNDKLSVRNTLEGIILLFKYLYLFSIIFEPVLIF